MSYVDVLANDPANAATIQQVVDSLKGTAGKGQPVALTALSDSVNFALSVKNLDAANSRGLQVLRANGNVLLQADATGLIGAPDGGAATAQLVNLSLAQTLTNKTLTSPVLSATAPTADGALGESAGGLLSVGNGTAAISLGAYKIAETVLGAPAATFNFTGIPATFRHLYLEVDGRFDQVIVNNSLLGTFNGDVGANYNRHHQAFTGTVAPTLTEALGQVSFYLGEFSGASATASKSGHCVAMIANYAGATFHKNLRFLASCINPNGAGTSVHVIGGGQWASTAAINRITLTAPGAGNWIAGSVATLYGLP